MADALRAELTLRLQRGGGMLPHHAAKHAASIVQSVSPEDALWVGIDVLFDQAMNTSSPAMFPSSPRRGEAALSPSSEVAGAARSTRSPSPCRRSLHASLKKTSYNSVVDPEDLIWSPEKSGRHFSLPPASLLKPRSTGLYEELTRTRSAVEEAEQGAERAKAASLNASLKKDLDLQMADRRLVALRASKAHAASVGDAQAATVRRREEALEAFLAKRDKAAATVAEVEAYNRDQKAWAVETRRAELEVERAILEEAGKQAADKQAALAARAAARKAEVREAMKQNGKEVALKKLNAVKSRAEEARLSEQTMADADAADAKRTAMLDAKYALIQAKLASTGDVIHFEDTADAEAAEKAGREADRIASLKAAELEAKSVARREGRVDCSKYQRMQLAEKERAHTLARVTTGRELEATRAGARAEAAEEEAKAAAARRKAGELRQALEKQMYEGARAKVVPSVDGQEAALHSPWIAAQRAKIAAHQAAAER